MVDLSSALATDTYDLAMRAFAATIMAHIANLRATAEMAEEVICRSRAFLAAQCPGDPGEPAVSAEPQPSYDEKLHVAHRLIEALREQRYAYELRHRWVCTEGRLVQSDYMRAKAVTRARSCENTRNRTYERRHNRRMQ